MFMGQVLQAGAGQITARQAAANAGIPMTVPATTINKVCLSGLNAIYLADQLIQAGEADIVVAGGMESMTQAPYLLPGARAGYRLGDQTVVDSMMYDGLFCAFDQVAMGAGTEKYAASAGLDREPAGRARRPSRHERAAGGRQGRPVRRRDRPGRGPAAQGRPDRGRHRRGRPRATPPPSRLGGLRPAFDKAGNITAGNASQISDGGAAVIVASKAAAESSASRRSARSSATARWPGPTRRCSPSRRGPSRRRSSGRRQGVATSTCSSSTRRSPPSGLASMADLGISDDIVNVNGGAIALGHPVGMSGTRVALTLLLELGRRGGGLGAAALCGGGGQGDAILLQTVA